MEIPVLTTPRLTLRPWKVEDAKDLYEILQQENLLQYFPKTTPPTFDRVERYILHHLVHWQERGYGHWAVICRQDGQLIGWNGLEYLPDSDEIEVAYLLSQPYWGKGLATEAAGTAVDFGFQRVGLSEVIGLVHPENIASRRVLEKIGMNFTYQAQYFGIDLLRYIRLNLPVPPTFRKMGG